MAGVKEFFLKSNFGVALLFFLVGIPVYTIGVFDASFNYLKTNEGLPVAIVLIGITLWTFLVFLAITISAYFYQSRSLNIESIKSKYELELNKAKQDVAIVENSGILACYSWLNEKLISENEEKLRSAFEKSGEKCGRIDILATTGFDLFSYDKNHEVSELHKYYRAEATFAPFHKLIAETKANIRILLLDPNSEWAKRRSYNIFDGDNDMCAKLIHRSISYLNKVKERREGSIELRFYDMEPIWKMIRSDDFIAVQGIAGKKEDRYNKWYLFESRQDGLSQGFDSLFKKKWSESKSDVNLNSDLLQTFSTAINSRS